MRAAKASSPMIAAERTTDLAGFSVCFAVGMWPPHDGVGSAGLAMSKYAVISGGEAAKTPAGSPAPRPGQGRRSAVAGGTEWRLWPARQFRRRGTLPYAGSERDHTLPRRLAVTGAGGHTWTLVAAEAGVLVRRR